MSYEFEEGMPDGCPPGDAKKRSGVVYRALSRYSGEIRDEHFFSHVKLGRGNANSGCCAHYGLSVWVDRAAVDHARQIIRGAQKWTIAAIKVDENDGVCLATPNDNQPEHHTFWKDQNADWKNKVEKLLNGAVQ